MSLVPFKGGIWPGRFNSSFNGVLASQALNTNTRKVALVFRVPRTGTLDLAEFWVSVVTTAQNLRVSFQNISTSTGNPDGTEDQYRVMTCPASAGWATPGLMTSDGTDGGTKRSVVRGDVLAFIIQFDSTAGSIVIGKATNNYVWSTFHNQDFNGTSWINLAGGLNNFVLKYSDGAYYCAPDGAVAIMSNGSFVAIKTTSTPDEAALSFQMPFDCEIGGMFAYLGFHDAGGTYDGVLYDAASVVLASRSGLPLFSGNLPYFIMFTSPVSLVKNTTYRLAILPTAANLLDVYYNDVFSSAIMGANPGGATWYYSVRTNAGAWTDTTTRRPLIAPWLTAVPDGT